MTHHPYSNEIQALVEDVNNHILIVSGPGCGKTHFILQRLICLIEQGIAPSQILVTTFTNASVQELYRRIIKHFNQAIVGLRIHTIHSFCYALLQEISIHTPLKEFNLMDDFTTRMIWHQHYKQWIPNLEKNQETLYAARGGDFISHFSKLNEHPEITQDKLLTWIQIPEWNPSIRTSDSVRKRKMGLHINQDDIVACYKSYNHYMWHHRYLDYSMLLKYVHTLCNQDHPSVIQAFKSISHILVDEYQDINPIQEQFFYYAAQQDCKVTAVGDDDQSIYRFRGASREPLLRFMNMFDACKWGILQHNYRNTHAIITASTKIVQPIQKRIPKTLISQKEYDIPVYWSQATNYNMQCETITSFILESLDKGWAKQPGDICLLFRSIRYSGSDLISMLNERLDTHGLALQKVDRLDFFNEPRIQAFREAFTVCLQKKMNPVQFAKIVTFLYGEPDDGEYFLQGHSYSFDTHFSALDADFSELEEYVLHHFHGIIETMENGKHSIQDTILGLMESSVLLLPQFLGTEESGPYLLGMLSEMARNFDQFVGGTIAEWVQMLHIFSEKHQRMENPFPISTDAIQCRTFHQAKGLEFPVVILPDLIQKRFPGNYNQEPFFIPPYPVSRPMDNTHTSRYFKWYYEKLTNNVAKNTNPSLANLHKEDARTLLYVGITRAESLVLLSSYSYDSYGKSCTHTSFLSEIRNHVEPFSTDTKLPTSINQNNPAVTRPTTDHIERVYSITSILQYIKCPFRYKLHYIFKIEPPLTKQQQLGSLIHAVLHFIHSKYKASNETPLEWENYLSFLVNKKYGKLVSGQDQQAVKEMIRKYLIKFLSEPKDNVYSEKWLEIPLKEVLLRGRADVYYQQNHVIQLLDFKMSSKQEPDERQIILYTHALKRQWDASLSFQTGFYFLKDGCLRQVSNSKENEQNILEEMHDSIIQIAKKKFPKTHSSSCIVCAYYSLCRQIH